MNKSESIVKLAPALLKAQKKMGAALKESKNPFFKSKYADLNAVIDASVPVLNDEGIVVLQTMKSVTDQGIILNTVETTLLHESGEYLTSSTPIVCSKQNDPQALGSAISYARRYGLQSMPTLKAEDDDGEVAMSRNSVSKNNDTTKSAPVSKAQVENQVATVNSFGSFRKGSK